MELISVLFFYSGAVDLCNLSVTFLHVHEVLVRAPVHVHCFFQKPRIRHSTLWKHCSTLDLCWNWKYCSTLDLCWNWKRCSTLDLVFLLIKRETGIGNDRLIFLNQVHPRIAVKDSLP